MGSVKHIFCNTACISRSRSSKVEDFDSNRKRVCGFLRLRRLLWWTWSVSYVWRLIGWKVHLVYSLLSFGALGPCVPFGSWRWS